MGCLNGRWWDIQGLLGWGLVCAGDLGGLESKPFWPYLYFPEGTEAKEREMFQIGKEVDSLGKPSCGLL